MNRTLYIIGWGLLIPVIMVIVYGIITIPYYVADKILGINVLWGVLFWLVILGIGVGWIKSSPKYQRLK